MNVIKILKDLVVFAQKSNDIEITQKLIAVQQEVINMENEIYELKLKNRELTESINKKKNIERYRNIPIISIKDDDIAILYCANCYGLDDKFIQLNVTDNDQCYCRNCGHYSFISKSPDASKIIERITDILD